MLLSLFLFAQISPLDSWRAEIAKLDHSQILIMRVTEDMAPPEDPEARSIITGVFQSPGFASQMARAEAMSVTNGGYHFILINPVLTPDKDVDAVLAHELGHLWLKAQGYPSLVFQGGDAGCLTVNAGDIVQHVLVRAELDKRKVNWRPHWLENLEKTTEFLERNGKTQPTAAVCQRLAQLALWVDVKVGLNENTWKGFPAFEKAMAMSFPELRQSAEYLAGYLSKLNLADKNVHREALRVAFTRMKSTGLEISRKPNETKTP